MSEPTPASTEPVPVRIQTLLPAPSGEDDLNQDTHPPAKRTDGWGLAIKAALSPDSYPPQIPSRSVSMWVEVAGQRKDAHLWRLFARACEEKNDYYGALAYATEAIRVQPDDVASLSLLAQLYEKQHADEAAAHWHQQVLLHDSTRKTSNRFLAHYYYRRSDYEKALPYFTQLLEADPQSRISKLYYLLTRVKASGIRGVANLLSDVHDWQKLSSEERALAHELFFSIGSQCLKNEHLVFATRYLTWAENLIPTPAGAVLLAKAGTLSAMVMEMPEISAQIPESVKGEGEPIISHQKLKSRTFLPPIMAAVGVAALAVALGLPLVFDQPHGFIAQQEKRFVSSDMRQPRLSDGIPSAPAPAQTDLFREPSPPTNTVSPQVVTTTLPPNADIQAKVATTSSSSIDRKPSATEASFSSKPEPDPKPKPVISEHPQRAGEKREKKATVSVPLGTMNNAAAAAHSTAPRNSQAKEQEAILSLPAAPQPSQIEEPLDQFAVASVPQGESETQEPPLPANDVSPESADSLLPVEQAAAAAPPPVEQEEQGKTKEVIGKPSLSEVAEGTKSVIPTFASQLPYATQSTTREREFPLSPEQLWPRLKALVEQETEVLLREDKEQGVLYGTIVQRQLGPRIHTFKPYGHYIVEVTPGATVGTSLVRAKILTFDWRPNKRPVPGAESLADRFLQKIGVIMR